MCRCISPSRGMDAGGPTRVSPTASLRSARVKRELGRLEPSKRLNAVVGRKEKAIMTSLSQSSGVVSSASSRTAIDTLVWLSDDAFAGDPAHSLLANPRDLPAEDWTALPPGGGRSIADILEHVAWSNWMYDDYAFGAA